MRDIAKILLGRFCSTLSAVTNTVPRGPQNDTTRDDCRAGPGDSAAGNSSHFNTHLTRCNCRDCGEKWPAEADRQAAYQSGRAQTDHRGAAPPLGQAKERGQREGQVARWACRVLE